MTQTALKLQLTDRQTADFEMIGNGGFAPLTGPQGSGILTSMARANALLDIPAETSSMPAGSTVRAILLSPVGA